MKWNLRLVAAQRGIWKATDLQRLLADHGLVISAGKMSGLWSKTPASLKLDDLDVICEVLRCEVGELLIADTPRVPEQRQGDRNPSGITTIDHSASQPSVGGIS